MRKQFNFKSLLQRLHGDEEGGVSLETLLIIGAIALPVLIFIITVAWPRIIQYFEEGMDDLEDRTRDARSNTGSTTGF